MGEGKFEETGHSSGSNVKRSFCVEFYLYKLLKETPILAENFTVTYFMTTKIRKLQKTKQSVN